MQLVRIPKVLIPKKEIDYSKWACIACDQFTAEPEYWSNLKEFVGNSPSCLNMILPEVYITQNNEEKIKSINQTMVEYYNNNFFDELESFIFVKRILKNGKVRLGLVVEIDLEQYDYTEKNNAYIKATEKTVVERLPVRIDIRKNATLELPHIMVLLDDADGNIIENLYLDTDFMDKIYDFDLNMNGGHLTGYKVNNNEEVAKKINLLCDKNYIKQKYNTDKNIAFVVGDGNHSLATAKECWNNLKQTLTEEEIKNHPQRFALVELVNIYDESLEFEPIHRLLLGANEDFIEQMQNKFVDGNARIRLMFGDEVYSIPVVENPSDAIKDIQDFIDEYKVNHNEVVEDYIHGDDDLEMLVKKHNAVGIFMPTIEKESLFDYCFRRGTLPRKAFSMGEAFDKRYYFEAKKIK